MTDYFSLNGKTVVLTGPVNEINQAVACALVSAGAAVYYISRDAAAVENFSVEIQQAGFTLTGKSAELLSSKAVKGALADIKKETGDIDILVHGWRESAPADILAINDDDWKQVYDAVLTEAFICTREALPIMLEQGRGKVVYLSSVQGMRGLPQDGIHYCAASSGLMALSRQLTLSYTEKGIVFNSLPVGYVDSDPKISPEEKELAIQKSPLKKIGRPEDIAAGVLFLASGASSYLAGETMHVNGGVYML